MFRSEDIALAWEYLEEDEIIIYLDTPAGHIQILGAVELRGNVLHLSGAMIQGLHRGALGIAGLNAIGRKMVEEAGVDQIVIQGGVRTSGRCQGRLPREIRFPRG